MGEDQGSTKSRILIVEDSEATRQLLEMCLVRYDYQLTSCATGPSGLEAALNQHFDLLLLDIALPGIDGWEILRQVRADATRSKLPVIVLTAHHDTTVTKDGPLLESIQGFIPKPFDISDLEATIATVLAETRDTQPEPEIL